MIIDCLMMRVSYRRTVEINVCILTTFFRANPVCLSHQIAMRQGRVQQMCALISMLLD